MYKGNISVYAKQNCLPKGLVYSEYVDTQRTDICKNVEGGLFDFWRSSLEEYFNESENRKLHLCRLLSVNSLQKEHCLLALQTRQSV
jgi:hypothetical protein